MTFSGYVTNGSIVLSSVCLWNVETCKVNRIYVVTAILANNWFYGIAGGNGILGIGPNSPYLRQFIDESTNTQTYSVVVGRGTQQPTLKALGQAAATTSPTNITLGAQIDPFYNSTNLTSFLNLTADSTSGTYFLSTQQSGVLGLGFG